MVLPKDDNAAWSNAYLHERGKLDSVTTGAVKQTMDEKIRTSLSDRYGYVLLQLIALNV